MRGLRIGAVALASFALAGCPPATPATDSGLDSGVDSGSDPGVDAAAPPPDASTRPPVVAAETADEAALARLGALEALPIPTTDRLAQASSEDRNGGPPYVSILFERENRDMSHFLCLGATADVREPNLPPMRFDVPTCPEPYVQGAVIARFEGSGALVRLWATLYSLELGPTDRERLLIWVDDDPEPVVDVPLAAAMDGTASPIFAPPFGAAARDRFAWYYPVVFARRIVVALDGLGPFDLVWHQSTARLDATPVARRPGASGREAAARSLEARPTGELRTFDGSVPAGASMEVLTIAGAGTLRELRAHAASREALRDLTVEIAWDGGPAAVDVPLLELFAAALDDPPSDPRSPISSTTDATGITLSLALPMPFTDGAGVTVVNDGSAAVALTLAASVDADAPDPAALRLHVERHETVAPAPDSHHPLASASGPGVFAGACLMLEGHALEGIGALSSPLNFLEGDERILVDGTYELRGTGTEDYLDGAMYFQAGPIAGPFAHGTADVDDGHASGCRWHVRTTSIDFATSLEASLEIGPGDTSVLERYRSVAFVYR